MMTGSTRSKQAGLLYVNIIAVSNQTANFFLMINMVSFSVATKNDISNVTV